MKANFNQEISKESIHIYLDSHRDYIYPFISIIVAVLLFLLILLPQILSFPAKKTTVDNEEKKLKEYETARNYVSTINVTNLNNELLTASKVLPTEKDYSAIINAVSISADNSKTKVVDYRFLLSTNQAKTPLASGSIPYVVFELNLQGSPDQIVEFINNLYITAPISEVSEVNFSGDTASMSINFYYEPLPSADINSTNLVRQRNSAETEVFNNISSWAMPEDLGGDIKIVPASDSADLNSVDLGTPF